MKVERLTERAGIHGALSDPHRLAIVDVLTLGDSSPSHLAKRLGIETNLLAHHLSILENVGLIERIRSQGDKRRRYLKLSHATLQSLIPPQPLSAQRVVFICTENAARSQLAKAIWNACHPVPAVSGGTHPAAQVHPGALAAARRHGLDLAHATPRPIPPLSPTDLVITVCDRANEHLESVPGLRLHWSVPDPATDTTRRAYDAATEVLGRRIEAIASNLPPGGGSITP